MASEEAPWEKEGYDAAAAEAGADNNDNQQQQADGDSPQEEANASGDAAVEQANEEEEEDDGGDYDPESVSFEPAAPQQPSESSTPAPAAAAAPAPTESQQRPAAAKPKMSGGFIVEASDDEDEDDEPAPQVNATNGNGEGGNNGTPAQSAEQQVPPQAQAQEQPASRSASVVPIPVPPPADPSEGIQQQDMPPIAGIDPTTLFEARIKEDPRGDMDAWLNLMADHKRRSNMDALRSVYNRFLEVFPQAADVWVEWIEMELGLDQFATAEQLFGKCLMVAPNVRLWTVYLNYIRRRNDLTNDASGQARRTVAQSYEFVIDNIGVDRDSGTIWQDYIQFIKSGPGQVGGTGWQDQQKMDQLRKAYHRAITVPMSTVNNLWKEYDQFEMGLNKLTGRKFIQERSPGYMSAKSANIALDNITRGIKRTNLPRLPPAPGFDGDTEFREQVDLWRRWISWEKDDPLVLADDEPKAYRLRVMYCYRQALMALRFWPEMWVEAAEWCFHSAATSGDKDLTSGTDMLVQGLAANPESVLLALKHADHIEANYPAKEGDIAEYAKAVRKPFNDVLDTLYKMGDKVKEREKLEISTLRQAAAAARPSIEHDDDDDYNNGPDMHSEEATENRIQAIQKGYAAESQLLSRTISHVWIAMARAMRRIQGKGNQTDGGLRSVFTEARHRGRLTSDVYVAVALLESVVYKDPVGAKIFERGARLFPNDEGFMVDYLKFLHSKDDTTNARVVFETCVNRMVSKPETLHKAKPLYAYFHKYECQFGELSQISKLEDRMAELFPEDPRLSYFTARYSSEKFDPVAAPIIISKAVQMRPKLVVPTIEQQPASGRNSPLPPTGPAAMVAARPPTAQHRESPRPQYARATASPKRPLGAMDDEELNPPKRLARGASPLKGAAGRRLDQQRRNQASALHRDINFLLTILPPAHTYDGQMLNAVGLTNLLRDTPLPESAAAWSAKLGQQQQQSRQTTPGGGPGHGRQTSADYGGSRPISPYGRLQSAGGYRNSPLGYGPPPPTGPAADSNGGQWGASGGYGQYGGYRY